MADTPEKPPAEASVIAAAAPFSGVITELGIIIMAGLGSWQTEIRTGVVRLQPRQAGRAWSAARGAVPLQAACEQTDCQYESFSLLQSDMQTGMRGPCSPRREEMAQGHLQ